MGKGQVLKIRYGMGAMPWLELLAPLVLGIMMFM
jgi:hypothetical protein